VRVNDLSIDGKTLTFVHSGEGSGPNYTAYLSKTDGSPPVRLGEGDARALSPDAKQVLTITYAPPQIILLPTGAGQPRRLERYGIEQYDGSGAGWLPNGRQVVFWGREPGHNLRSYVQDIYEGPPRPITPEGLVGRAVSPDGRSVLAEDSQQNKFLCSIERGEPQTVPGLTAEDFIARWTTDPGVIFIYRRGEFPVRVYRFFLATGHKELVKELVPSDPAGIVVPVRVLLTPDGKGYVYAFGRQLSDLYLVDGLK
jgi:dipeptidyl aminopeptidase/acylaminoacyl peptidase